MCLKAVGILGMASLELHCRKVYTCSSINDVMYIRIRNSICMYSVFSQYVCVLAFYWYLALLHCLFNVIMTVGQFRVDQTCGIVLFCWIAG